MRGNVRPLSKPRADPNPKSHIKFRPSPKSVSCPKTTPAFRGHRSSAGGHPTPQLPPCPGAAYGTPAFLGPIPRRTIATAASTSGGSAPGGNCRARKRAPDQPTTIFQNVGYAPSGGLSGAITATSAASAAVASIWAPAALAVRSTRLSRLRAIMALSLIEPW